MCSNVPPDVPDGWECVQLNFTIATGDFLSSMIAQKITGMLNQGMRFLQIVPCVQPPMFQGDPGKLVWIVFMLQPPGMRPTLTPDPAKPPTAPNRILLPG